jgi:predicted TIM-barrel fold metal-dependent hydrolase
VFGDPIGLLNRDLVGIDNIMHETDFPHIDGPFTEAKAAAARLCSDAGMTDAEQRKFLRGNAIRVYSLERYGIDA